MAEKMKDFKDVTTEFDWAIEDNKEFRILRSKYSYEYITEHKSDSLTKFNLIILRDIKPLSEEFGYITRLSKIVWIFYSHIYDRDRDQYRNSIGNEMFKLHRICEKLNEQYEIVRYITHYSKNIRIGKKIYEIFKRDIHNMNSHLKRLNIIINNYYIIITPLYHYNKMLSEKGILLRDEILSMVNMENHTYSEYVDIIYSSIGDKSEEIRKSIEERKAALSGIKEYRASIRIHEAEEKKNYKYQHALELLENAENVIRNNLDIAIESSVVNEYVIRGKGFRTWIKFMNRINEFKEDNECDQCKIFIYRKLRSTKDTVHYYSDHRPEKFTDSIGSSTIYSIDEEVPEYILDKNILYREIIF